MSVQCKTTVSPKWRADNLCISPIRDDAGSETNAQWLPGGGFGFGYGASNGVGNPLLDISWPALDQGQNAVDNFIPVARISDMLLNPKSQYDFKGQLRIYPDIKPAPHFDDFWEFLPRRNRSVHRNTASA